MKARCRKCCRSIASFSAYGGRRVGQIGKYRIAGRSVSPSDFSNRYLPPALRENFLQLRQGDDFFGMANENLGQIVAGFKQDQGAAHPLLMLQHGGITLRTAECRTQKAVKILSGLRVQVCAAHNLIQGRGVGRQTLENLLAGGVRRRRFERTQ